MRAAGNGGAIINICSLDLRGRHSDRGALRLVEDRAARHDARARGRVGAARHPRQRHRARLFPHRDDRQFFESERLAETMLAKIPLGRFGALDDLVGAAIFLASDARDIRHRPLPRRWTAAIWRRSRARGDCSSCIELYMQLDRIARIPVRLRARQVTGMAHRWLRWRALAAIAVRATGGIAVSVRRVGMTYPGVTAVDDVSFDLTEGAFLTILGPFRLRQDDAAAHDRRLPDADGGRDRRSAASRCGAVPPYRRSIGMVFQRLALFPHMTRRGERRLPA